MRKEYHHYNSTPLEGWNCNDTLEYVITDLNPDTPITISLNLRNRYNYKYENLVLKIIHNLEDSSSPSIKVVELPLANNSGIWLGDGWGSLRQTNHLLEKIQKPNLTDSTYIKILQIMPDSILEGIEDVGIRITH